MNRKELLESAAVEIRHRQLADERQFDLLVSQSAPGNRAVLEDARTRKRELWNKALDLLAQITEPSDQKLASGHVVKLEIQSGKSTSVETWVLVREFPTRFEFRFNGMKVIVGSGEAGFGGTLIGAALGSSLTIPGDGRGIPTTQIKVLGLVASI